MGDCASPPGIGIACGARFQRAALALRLGFLAALAAVADLAAGAGFALVGAGAGLALDLALAGPPRAGRRRCAGGLPSVERASISDTASSSVTVSGVLSEGSDALTPSWLT